VSLTSLEQALIGAFLMVLGWSLGSERSRRSMISRKECEDLRISCDKAHAIRQEADDDRYADIKERLSNIECKIDQLYRIMMRDNPSGSTGR